MEILWELITTPVAVAAVVILGIYFFLRINSKSYDCWEKRGVPFVKPKPLFGSILDNIKKPLHDTELERYVELGQVYGYFEGAAAMLSVGDPKLLRDILVKDFQFFTDRRGLSTGDTVTESMLQLLKGEEWKRVRSIVTPTFTTGKIKRMLGIFTSCSQVLVENFRKLAEKDEPFEAKKIFGAFTMDIIASSAFSTKLDSHNDPNNTFVQKARTVFTGNVNYRFVLYLLFPRLMRLFKVPIFPPEGVKFFTDVTLQIINERKRTGQTRNDFLQLLLDTANEQQSKGETEKQDDMLSNYGGEMDHQIFNNYKPAKKALSFNEMVAQCVIFFLAGFETTASTLSFVAYYLALNQDIQERLRKEVDDTIIACDGELTYEAVQNMTYLDNVISETMRLNPPAIRLERVANSDYKLGDTGVVIPKGTVITVPTYAMQRDAKYFPNPEKFDPDRFTAEEKAKRSQYAFLPFGAGPRNCVGMRFALVEVKVCLAYVISNFKINRCAETKVPLEYFIGQGLLQPKGITIKMEVRENSPLKR